jgi:hypothetical protein
MPELLNNPVVRIVIGVVVLVVLVQLARKLFSRQQKSKYHVLVRCRSCGWQGLVGKFNLRCNACGSVSVDSLEG